MVGTSLWIRFNTQITDLITELNEAPTHFIRCIKPNEEYANDKFVDSLVLEQINSMRILDSIKFYKHSYPNRLEYEEFYKRYEDLCSTSLVISFKALKAQNNDFLELSKEIMKEQLVDIGKDLYVFGKHRVFFKDEIKVVLEEARSKAQYYKKQAVSYINDAIILKQAKDKHIENIAKIYRLQRFIRTHIKRRAISLALMFARRTEKSLVSYRNEQMKGIEESIIKNITKLLIVSTTKSILSKGIKARKIIGSRLLLISAQNKMRKIIFLIRIMSNIVNTSWKTINNNICQRAALIFTKIVKGYLVRKQYAKEIQRAKEIG